ncbi:MAG: hypothetical protein AAF830_09095 [Pseudomonadota bacterium]
MRTVKLGWAGRRPLDRKAEAIYARLVARSSKFEHLINARENLTINLLSAVRLGAGFAVGAGVGFVYGDALAELFGVAFLGSEFGPLAFGALGAVIVSVVVSLLFGLLPRPPLFQQMAELFVFNTKWTNPRRRKEMVRAVLNWLQRQPEMTFEATKYLYGTDRSFALLPKKVRAGLTDLMEGTTRAVVLRNAFERKLKSEYLANGLASNRDLDAYRERYFLQSRGARNGIRASLLMDALTCELRDEIKTGPNWRRQRYTDEGVQMTTIRDNADVTLRYRTGAPHYRWPNPNDEKSDGETAPYLLYTAIENPSAIGLFVITVDQIIARMPEAVAWQLEDEDLSEEELEAELDSVLCLLEENEIEMYGKWDEKTLRQRSEVALVPQPVLKNLSGDPDNPDWGLRWDPNRIDWSQFQANDGAIRRAFAALLKAVDLAEEDAEVVRLARGDGLIIDNLRAMVRRRELGAEGVSYFRQVADYPETWWLNVYYGFRKSKKPDFLGI